MTGIHRTTGTALWVLSAVLIGGCAGQQAQTLGALKYRPEPEPSPEIVENASHEEVRAEYQELLTLIDDENLKEQIERRIAHVYMVEGEQDQVAVNSDPSAPAQPSKSYYMEAIKSYREVLEKYPNSPDNAEILYQLAKAYDMEGDQDEALTMLVELTRRHPGYENIAEAHFRKGDILFNRGDYAGAENDYRAVTQHPDTKFYLNAYYMLGWSQYKQLHYRSAMTDFVFVLNQLLGPVESIDALSKPDQSLANDTLHAVSLGLDKLAGAAAIETLPDLKDQHYVWMVYDNLGQYYLDKELFEASAETYRLYIASHDNLDRTPLMHRKMIETYETGSFPAQAFKEKEAFVDAYGIYSSYAKSRDGINGDITDTMQAYLDELSQNYHARGQELHTEMAELKEDEQREPDPDKLADLDSEALEALDKAAYFYQQFIDTFPGYEKLDELYFLRAEALFAARHFDQAIPDYERVAYDSTTPIADEYDADAGYAAIVSYENFIDTLTNETVIDNWRADAVDSMLRFAEQYHQDERSASVLTNAADYIFSLEQYPRALEVATGLIDSNPDLDPDLKKTAYGIQAHSLFKLERYDEASASYLNQRQLVDSTSEEYTQINERLASSVYRHSETIMSEDDRESKETAVAELLKLKTLTPDSPVRITAQYDAATLLIELEAWPRAIAELQELVTLYPEHELAVEFPRKLAFSYEKNEDWLPAAQEYLKLSDNDPDQELRRESLYLAATMYENNGDYRDAIEQFTHYDERYPEPFDSMMEARYRLAQNYQTINNQEQKRHWLQQLVDGDLNAGSQRSDRSRWLGAWANAQYGDYYAENFAALSLSLPLDQSLTLKNEQLENASARYQAAADTGIFEFVTMSSYKIADLYQQFAQELRESPRPAGLGAEDQQLYTEILEEQALPLDELAMELHLSNIERAWDGEFNDWINQSFGKMGQLSPTRFAKAELIVSYGDEIR